MFLWTSVLPEASLLPNVSAYPTALGTESGRGEEGVGPRLRLLQQRGRVSRALGTSVLLLGSLGDLLKASLSLSLRS